MHARIRNSLSIGVGLVMAAAILVLGYQADQTRNAEVAARAARDDQARRAELIVQSSPVPTIMCGNQAVVTVVNPAAEMLFGYTADELIGRPMDLLIPKEQRYDHRKLFDAARKKAQARPEERYAMFREGLRSVGLHRNGTRIPVVLSIRVIKYGDDIEFIANIRPILSEDNPLRHQLSHQRLETADPSFIPQERPTSGGFQLPVLRSTGDDRVQVKRDGKP